MMEIIVQIVVGLFILAGSFLAGYWKGVVISNELGYRDGYQCGLKAGRAECCELIVMSQKSASDA